MVKEEGDQDLLKQGVESNPLLKLEVATYTL
jgi:hypothetical protein